MKLSAAAVVCALAAGAVSTPSQWKRDNATCKCYPGDECWPTDARWKALNQAVQGRLSSFIPAGAVCYPTFNNVSTASAAKCDAVKANWTNPSWIVDQQFESFSRFWSNNSCSADNKCNGGCTAGLSPAMVVIAKNQFDIQVSVNFARINNLRLVIRNTGHDYLGRSMGWGSLGLNTHNLANIQFVKAWTGPGNWTGGAVKLGAGVMFRDLYAAAHAQNVDVVGGESLTVGAAGGYVLGGGHSPLSGIYGLASDNVLEYNVLLASGSQVAANAESNPDLFWALRGGGMSSVGAVYGVTLKTRPTVQVAGATLNMTISQPNFWKGVAAFHSFANTLTDAGFYASYAISPKTGLSVQPFVAPNATADDLSKVLKPLLDKLAALNVTYKMDAPKTFPTFYDLHRSLFAPTDDAGGSSILGGRLISRDDVAKNDDAIVAAIKAIVDAGHPWGGRMVNPGRAAPDPTGALGAAHPVWRNAADVGLWMYSADECGADRRKALDAVTHTFGDALRKASPASAVYANEGDVNEPNWQEAFWGSNYKKLLEVKAKYDPDNVFWAKSTPGSEKWALQSDEKRLCKV